MLLCFVDLEDRFFRDNVYIELRWLAVDRTTFHDACPRSLRSSSCELVWHVK